MGKQETTMKIGITAWNWTSPFRTDKDLGLVAKAASFGAEVFEFAMEDDAQVNAAELKRALGDAGLECSVVGPYGAHRDLSHPDAEVRKQGEQHAKQGVDLCSEIGSAIFTGPAVGFGGVDVLTPETRSARLHHAARSLRGLGDYAAQAGVRLGVEILNRYEDNVITTAEEAREFIDLVDHPSVGIHLDAFHMNIEEVDPAGAVMTAGDRIVHFHAAGSHRGTPGAGNFAWPEVAAALKKVDYAGYVVIEAFHHEAPIAQHARIWRPLAPSPDELAQEGIAFLKGLLAS
jgi:D-psicose/D-tagatose/L-ribulose 3-epimerase